MCCFLSNYKTVLFKSFKSGVALHAKCCSGQTLKLVKNKQSLRIFCLVLALISNFRNFPKQLSNSQKKG